MKITQKTLFALAVALIGLTSPVSAQSVSALQERETDLDELYAELKSADQANWERVQDRIFKLWARSGSASADLLLERGMDALEADNVDRAIEHFTALTDHAPDFAEGWSARATAFYLSDEYGLALLDAQRALALNPRHFGVLTGVGIIFEELQEYDAALAAFKAAFELNPHPEHVKMAIERLERRVGEVAL